MVQLQGHMYGLHFYHRFLFFEVHWTAHSFFFCFFQRTCVFFFFQFDLFVTRSMQQFYDMLFIMPIGYKLFFQLYECQMTFLRA